MEKDYKLFRRFDTIKRILLLLCILYTVAAISTAEVRAALPGVGEVIAFYSRLMQACFSVFSAGGEVIRYRGEYCAPPQCVQCRRGGDLMKATTNHEACILRLIRNISVVLFDGKIPTPAKVVYADTARPSLERVIIFDPSAREITTTAYELVVPLRWQDQKGVASILTGFMAKIV